MGCDIHVVVQRKTPDGWEDIPLGATRKDRWDHPLEWRNYEGFAVLANVRNRQDIVPISDPRGLPEDFSTFGEYHCGVIHERALTTSSSSTALAVWSPFAEDDWVDHDDDKCIWMGDHSQSWVMADELINYDWDAVVTDTIVLTLDQYFAWTDKSKRPEGGYCRGVGGGSVVTFSEYDIPSADVIRQLKKAGKSLYVSATQKITVAEAAWGWHEKVIAWLNEQGDASTIRIVFGFDS